MSLVCLIPNDNEHPGYNRGFTLIEVLIGLAIFAVGILAIASLQIRSINLNSAARIQSEATVAAVDCMERLLSLPYEHPDLDESSGTQQSSDGRVHGFLVGHR